MERKQQKSMTEQLIRQTGEIGSWIENVVFHKILGLLRHSQPHIPRM